METNLYFRTIFSRCIDISEMNVVAKFQFNSIYGSSIILKRKLFQLLSMQSKKISKGTDILS